MAFRLIEAIIILQSREIYLENNLSAPHLTNIYKTFNDSRDIRGELHQEMQQKIKWQGLINHFRSLMSWRLMSSSSVYWCLWWPQSYQVMWRGNLFLFLCFYVDRRNGLPAEMLHKCWGNWNEIVSRRKWLHILLYKIQFR